MQADILEFKNFYHGHLGRQVYYSLSKALNEWQITSKKGILGYGFATPYLNNHAISFMPAAQGIMLWPCDTNRNALVYENALPLKDQSVDTILVIHGFEFCHFPDAFLEECWRVLKGDGRLIMAVTNRRGLWAHKDSTPLGMGQPYTMTQLTKHLKQKKFDVNRRKRLLYKLPFKGVLAKLVGIFFEMTGPRFMSKFSGLIMIEAVKEVYHPRQVGLTEKVKPRLQGRLRPAMTSSNHPG